MDLYRLTIQDSQDTMQFDLLDAPINIEDVEGAVDNTVLSGDIFTDFLYLKKRWEQKWAIMCKDEYERLRGFYTRQWSLATVPSVKVTQGYLKGTEWEGQIIYINAPYGGEIDGLTKMTGDTFQQAISGKNLFNAQGNYVVGQINGNTGAITEDSTDTTVTTGIGSIKVVNSHPSSNFRGYISDKIVLQAGSYALSFTRAETTGHYVAVFTFDSNDNFLGRAITLSGQATSGNGNISNQVAYVRIAFETNTHGTTVTFNGIQLEAGSTATDYEPYVGGTPSPNPEYPQPIQTVTGTQTITINGQAFTIDLGTIELNDLGNGYQDEIAFDGTEWKLRKKTAHETRDVKINGIRGTSSGNTTASAMGAFSVISFDGGWMGDYATTLGIATLSANIGQFKLDTSVNGDAAAENMQDGTFCQRQGTNDRCYFRATSLIGKTGDEVRAILAPQGGVNAWWGLQTPTETTITDQNLITQLEAVRAALIEGQNLVEVTANGSNLPAKSITLQGAEGREKPILPQTNVRIGLSDGGVLNACECRQNVTLSMRETA